MRRCGQRLSRPLPNGVTIPRLQEVGSFRAIIRSAAQVIVLSPSEETYFAGSDAA
jgi:hypothetical protein